VTQKEARGKSTRRVGVRTSSSKAPLLRYAGKNGPKERPGERPAQKARCGGPRVWTRYARDATGNAEMEGITKKSAPAEQEKEPGRGGTRITSVSNLGLRLRAKEIRKKSRPAASVERRRKQVMLLRVDACTLEEHRLKKGESEALSRLL